MVLSTRQLRVFLPIEIDVSVFSSPAIAAQNYCSTAKGEKLLRRVSREKWQGERERLLNVNNCAANRRWSLRRIEAEESKFQGKMWRQLFYKGCTT